MIQLPVLRWGQPYTCMEVDDVVHFSTGEPIARVSRANGGLIGRDMRKAQRAREVLREIPIDDLIARVGAAGELYMNATLPMGDGSQTPDEFAKAQSASTGLPERMCRANMKKNGFVLAEMRRILTSLTRGLVVRRAVVGARRRARRSDQLPGAEPGARPRAAVELARRAHAVAADHPDADRPRAQAGPAGTVDAVPHGRSVLPGRASRAKRSRSIPAEPDVGAAVLEHCERALDLRRHGDGRSLSRQRQGAGARSWLLEDPPRRRRGRQLGEVPRLMVESVFANSGRGCINCSGIWASRHTREIADALAKRLAAVRPLKPDNPDASLAAFTIPGAADAISQPDRREPAGARRHRRHRDASATARASSRTGSPTTCCRRSCTALARSGDRQAGVHVPVRHGGRVSRGEDDRGDRPDARVHARSRASPTAAPARSMPCTSIA